MTTEYYSSIFCNNLIYLRQKLQLSQAQMAKKLHITVKSLRLLEQNIIPPRLSSDIIFRIHRQFNIHPKDMFDPKFALKNNLKQ